MKVKKLTLTPIISGTRKMIIKNPENPWYLMKCQIESLDRFTKPKPQKSITRAKYKKVIPFLNYKYLV